MDRQCLNCGSKLKANDAFCCKCGQQVEPYRLEEHKSSKRKKMGWAIAFAALLMVVVVAAVIITMHGRDSQNEVFYVNSTINSKNTGRTTSGGGSVGGEIAVDVEDSTLAKEYGIDFNISNLYGTWEYMGYYVDIGYEKGELPSGELIRPRCYRDNYIEGDVKMVFNDNGQMYHAPVNSISGYDYYDVVEWFGSYDIYCRGNITQVYNLIDEDTILLKVPADLLADTPPAVELYKKVSDDMDPTVINGNRTAEIYIFEEWNTWKYYPVEYDGIEGYACEIGFDNPFHRMQFLSNTQVLIGDSIYLTGAFDDPIWPKEFIGQGDGLQASIQIVHPDELRVYLNRENEEDIVLYYNGVWG